MKFPMQFSVSSHSASGMEPFTASADNLPALTCAIPPEFNGPGGGYSPEELYALAFLSCYIATFKVFAQKAKFSFKEIRGKTTLIVDRNAQGVAELQKLDVAIELTGVQDQQKAQQLFKDAERFCLVSNAVKSQKSYSYSILSE